MSKPDHRTLTNQPDPPDYGKATPKRIPTQIHRRTPSAEPLADQWNAGSGRAPENLRTPPDKMGRRTRPKRP